MLSLQRRSSQRDRNSFLFCVTERDGQHLRIKQIENYGPKPQDILLTYRSNEILRKSICSQKWEDGIIVRRCQMLRKMLA